MMLSGTSPRQIRAARALLGWSQSDLAEKAGISITVVARIETAMVDARMSTIAALLECFEAHGVEFANTSDGGMGVILRATAK